LQEFQAKEWIIFLGIDSFFFFPLSNHLYNTIIIDLNKNSNIDTARATAHILITMVLKYLE
jgi:hypothetical protein